MRTNTRGGRWLSPRLLLGWLLITPPYGGPPWSWSMGVGCGDPGHANPCTPLSLWTRLGSFEDEAACQRARTTGSASAYGRDDEKWAAYEIARCFTEERIRNGPGLRPGE